MELIYKEMSEMFSNLPNHKQEPVRFSYYVRLYRYYKSKEIQ
jgi:hypothetical protein